MDSFYRELKKVFFDSRFLSALLLGPVVWLVLDVGFEVVVAPVTLQMLLMVCLVYPVLEELAFRGFVQSWLIEKPAFARYPLAGLSVANLVTSVLFSAAHFFNQAPLWAASVFFPSLVFGFFRDRFNRVWPSIVLHCWYNTGFFVVLS